MNRQAYNRQLIQWAKRAIHGLDESHVFVGILDDRPMDTSSAEFMLQLGYSVLMGKIIVVPVPFRMEVPEKLAKVADY